ncbi:MAG: hypothetical protein Q8R82_05095 [Hyphomonadaceae bacterium]|nr:hypothetical protein [Hyphomonadaceae bacterium]
MQRSCKTEGGLAALAAHAVGAAVRETFEVVEQPSEIGEALQKPRE